MTQNDEPKLAGEDLVLEINDINESIALGPLEELVGYHLRRAAGFFSADFTRVVGGTGMRQVLVGILSVVSANPGINQGAVGRSLGIMRANMVSLIIELIDAGLVNRRTAKGSRRAFALYTTPTGDKALAACLKKIQSHESRLLAKLSEKERGTLIGLLQRIEVLED